MKKKFSTDGFIARKPINRINNQQVNPMTNNFDKKIDNNVLMSSLGDNSLKPNSSYGSSYFGTKNPTKIKEKPIKKISRRQRRQLEKRLVRRPKRPFFKIVKWLFIIILLAILSYGVYTTYRVISAGSNVFQGSIFDIFANNKPIKKDENGRSNFLIFGTAEDDPGHDSVYLTDSMMVVSVSQEMKDVYIFSVPRDLEVDYGGHCLSNRWRGKINEYYNCVNDVADDTENDAAAAEQERLLEMQKLVGDVFGMEIQYSAHVNYTVLKDVVDAVGGIDVYIEGSLGEPGILDRNNDWRCNYECYYVKYDNGTYHLDGEHALYLALARGHEADINNRFSPTYGLSRSNPDREVNQQKILVALKEKAMNNGLLSNLGAVASLIDSLGGNLRTNIQMSEIGTILEIAKEIDIDNINRIDLMNEGVMDNTGNPVAGKYNYIDIQDFLTKKLSNNPLISEEAPIVILNGTEQTGLAHNKATELEEIGYTIYYYDSAPESTYEKTEVYQVGLGSNGTATALEKLFGTTIKTTDPPISVDQNTQFVVVLGADTINQE